MQFAAAVTPDRDQCGLVRQVICVMAPLRNQQRVHQEGLFADEHRGGFTRFETVDEPVAGTAVCVAGAGGVAFGRRREIKVVGDESPLGRARDCWFRQLQQIPGVSQKVAVDVTQRYPTLLSLFEAYQRPDLSEVDKQMLVSERRFIGAF